MPLKKELLIDRDLSWLSFNKRLLEEAQDDSLPIYDRIKFLAIYSSNLDEFFRVRVASLRSLAGLGKKNIKRQLAFSPKKLLQSVLNEVNDQLKDYGGIFQKSILPELKNKGIRLYYNEKILKTHLRECTVFFKSHILAHIQPYFFQPSDKLFIENNGIYFIVELEKLDGSEVTCFAHLRIPTEVPRFLQLSAIGNKHYIAFIDDIIRQNLNFIFKDYKVLNCFSVKLNRDQDVDLENSIDIDIVSNIKKQLEKRKVGVPTRFLYDKSMPDYILKTLVDTLELEIKDLVPGGRYHNLNDLMALPNPIGSALKSKKLTPVSIKVLDDYQSIFKAIEEKDRILHFPYQSYDYILRFFNEAATDPSVTSIKATLYRIAANSVVAQSFISAAKNGKKVEVFVELKARFDEANNIRWAERMIEAGVIVTYSLPDLKVHAKVVLIRRKTDNGVKKFAFFGTGNFNENTAGIYADHGLLTTHNGMTQELESVFHLLQKGTEITLQLKYLLVARHNMQTKLIALIDREIEHVKNGKIGHFIIKLNNLEEETMIEKLYEASQAGVQIDLIIRGICRLRPGIPEISDNIKAIRVVDGFLEHARIFKFYNNGNPELFMSSADWMSRNLHRRIEVGFPIYDEDAFNEISQLLELQLKDNTKARSLDSNLNHHLIHSKTKAVRSQTDFYKYLVDKEKSQKM